MLRLPSRPGSIAALLVCLDLAGPIPSVTEARDFLDDCRPEKRRLWVDRILQADPAVKRTSLGKLQQKTLALPCALVSNGSLLEQNRARTYSPHYAGSFPSPVFVIPLPRH